MNIILHITHRQKWENSKQNGSYRGDTLDTEGFIHCSTPEQIVKTANRFFAHQQELVLLCIDSDKVQPEIKYEGVAEDELFPHIYGLLNLDAVFQVLDFEPGADGSFEIPPEIAQMM
ncbi:MAG: DUF952 domain-containing protein [Nostocaceae cyanobacterium]|nr:DUF952 domain-containing protein [Nostocaceae cyanobacterium]